MQAESSDLLRLEQVHTYIKDYHILQGVDLAVARCGVTALLGRNGAGKTTTLRTIMGLWRASHGSTLFNGQPIAAKTTPEIARLGIAYVPEDMGIFAQLTVQENVSLAARRGAIRVERLDWIFSLFPALHRFWLRPAGTLSGGQKQMLAIARAIIEPCELLLIDEPTKGLAPSMVDSLQEALLALKRANTTILLVEQNLSFVAALADGVAVMDGGRIVHHGDMTDLLRDQALQHRLLGLDLAGEIPTGSPLEEVGLCQTH